MIMNATAELLRSQSTVYHPLLIPRCDKSVVGGFGDYVQYVRAAEGAESGLHGRIQIWITFVQGGCAKPEQDEAGVQEELVGEIPMDILGQVTVITNVTRCRINLPPPVAAPFCTANQSE